MSAYKDKKTGKWCAHVRYTDWQGEARRKLKRGFKTKREALAWEREFLASASGDLTMTLGEFVRAYEEDRRPRLKLNTWITKDYIIKDKILPYFANKPMNEIGPRDIVKWQNAVMREGERSGRPYSQTYLKTIQNQLTAIFSHAVRYYGLKVNPAAKAGSMGRRRANEMRFWTLEQYSRFAEEAMEEPRACI
ncbi:Arm DNA-binding domain-containing protein [Enorma burkinafasonensis]|uniref:Arm DNA-binding domain-containing protein n=1 Tax=Enorma burkinafasonensis TaxID=2590867 RepID=UPI0011A94651|nr:Arm DNA-binding domain-containing protein [Enorma burkinafasonensis]